MEVSSELIYGVVAGLIAGQVLFWGVYILHIKHLRKRARNGK